MDVAIMKRTIELLGTDLILHKGEKVYVCRATNQPNNQGKFFASPFSGKWVKGNTIFSSPDDSILVHEDDFESITDSSDIMREYCFICRKEIMTESGQVCHECKAQMDRNRNRRR